MKNVQQCPVQKNHGLCRLAAISWYWVIHFISITQEKVAAKASMHNTEPRTPIRGGSEFKSFSYDVQIMFRKKFRDSSRF